MKVVGPLFGVEHSLLRQKAHLVVVCWWSQETETVISRDTVLT